MADREDEIEKEYDSQIGEILNCFTKNETLSNSNYRSPSQKWSASIVEGDTGEEIYDRVSIIAEIKTQIDKLYRNIQNQEVKVVF